MLNKKLRSTLIQLQTNMNWHYAIAARKAKGDPSLPNHFSKSADYYSGIAWGQQSAITGILQATHAYKGFSEVDNHVNFIGLNGGAS